MKILLITILFLQYWIAFAQDIEITVLNKNSRPMPYAYILINNKPAEISDTMGIAFISQKKLSDNDTISVSYIGASPARIIFDQSLRKTQKHTFYLEESVHMLKDAIVEYQDIKKLFKKSTKFLPALNYNCIMDSEFDVKIMAPDQETFFASGKLEGSNEIWSKEFSPRRYGYFHHPLKFITDSDTRKTNYSLNYYTHHALNFVNLAITIGLMDQYGIYKPFYSYLGEKDNYLLFRISYPQNTYLGYPFQIIFSVDKNSKYIHTVEFEAINLNSDSKTDFNKLSISYDCVVFTHKKPHMSTIYLPVKIEYKAQTNTGFQVDLDISNVSIKQKRF